MWNKLLILPFFLLFSCADKPEDVAKKFTEYLANGEINKAQTLATKPTKKFVTFIDKMGLIPKNTNYKFIKVSDSTVKNKIWIKYYDFKGKVETIELIKTNKKWLVNIDLQKELLNQKK